MALFVVVMVPSYLKIDTSSVFGRALGNWSYRACMGGELCLLAIEYIICSVPARVSNVRGDRMLIEIQFE